MAKRISIINFKGGVGKTTLAFHLGAGLAWLHDAKVLLIDMDHQSSLSILCLGSNGWTDIVRRRRTVDQIFRFFFGQGLDLPDDSIICKSPLWDVSSYQKSYRKVDIVPASLRLDDIEIDLTASQQANPIQSEWNKRTLLCQWIEKTGIDQEYDYIIFDCPPATKIVSQNAIAASHGYIIPVVPEAVMERGAPHLRGMVRTGIDERLKALAQFGDPRSIHVSDTKLVGLAITRIQTSSGYSGYTNDHTQHLESLQRTWGNSLMKPYIHQGAGVSEALSDSVPVYNRSGTQNIGGRGIDQQYIDLTNEIKRRVDRL